MLNAAFGRDKDVLRGEVRLVRVGGDGGGVSLVFLRKGDKVKVVVAREERRPMDVPFVQTKALGDVRLELHDRLASEAS